MGLPWPRSTELPSRHGLFIVQAISAYLQTDRWSDCARIRWVNTYWNCPSLLSKLYHDDGLKCLYDKNLYMYSACLIYQDALLLVKNGSVLPGASGHIRMISANKETHFSDYSCLYTYFVRKYIRVTACHLLSQQIQVGTILDGLFRNAHTEPLFYKYDYPEVGHESVTTLSILYLL